MIYYGFPFPNTAYAKLGHGIDRGELVHQGWLYLLDSIDRDPVTLVAILFAVTMGLAYRGPARWVAAGVLIDLAYVVSVGGDFMSGRFLALPLFAAVLILSRAVPFEHARALTAASLLAVVGLTSAQIPLLSDSRVERTNASMDPRVSDGEGIVDERAYYFATQSLLVANRQSLPSPESPTGATQLVPTGVDMTCGQLGVKGLQGPLTHLLDECALADPLLARLPAAYDPGWRIGHFIRMIPEGYRESLQQDVNLLADIGIRPIYDDLRLITRTPRLLSRARLAAIWRVNTGAAQRQIDHRFYRFAYLGESPVVHVRWVQNLEEAQRTEIEQSLGLHVAEHRAGSTWSYWVPDVSPDRFDAIIAHDLVDDAYGFDPAADARFGPRIHVRWVETVRNAQRTALERALVLYRAEHVDGITWRYRVPDASPQRLGAIVAHEMVADTYGFDRGSLELDAPAGDVARLAIQPLVHSSGWHPAESDPTAPESTWQWTQQTATLSLANPNAEALFYLDYAAGPDVLAERSQTVTVSIGGQVLQSFVADTAGRRLRRILLPATVLGTGDTTVIQIAVDRTFVPTTRPAGEPDGRDLGIQVFHAFVVLR